LLAAAQSAAEQYRWRSRLRWSGTKNSPQHKHLRCPDCAIAAPRLGRAGRPHRPRARQKAQSEEDGHQPRRRRVKDVDQKKTKDEEQARSHRLKKSRFGSALSPSTVLDRCTAKDEGVELPTYAPEGAAERYRAIEAKYSAMSDLRRPEETANAITWQRSDAAGFVNAAVLAVDGENTARLY